MGVKKWEARDEEKRTHIIRSLSDGEKSWKSLWDSGRVKLKCRTTLSLYLEALEKEGHIKKSRRREGRSHAWYSLVKTGYVDQVLGRPVGRIKILVRIDLSLLDEEQFLNTVIIGVKRQLQPIIRDYRLIGEGLKKGVATEGLQRVLQSHISNLTDFIHKGGDYMVKRIREESLDSEKMKSVETMMLSESRKEFVEMAEMQRGEAKPGGLELVMGEMKLGEKIKAEDVGGQNLGAVSVLPVRKNLVAVTEIVDEEQSSPT